MFEDFWFGALFDDDNDDDAVLVAYSVYYVTVESHFRHSLGCDDVRGESPL